MQIDPAKWQINQVTTRGMQKQRSSEDELTNEPEYSPQQPEDADMPDIEPDQTQDVDMPDVFIEQNKSDEEEAEPESSYDLIPLLNDDSPDEWR